jgi:superfamily II DNA or RNA helicase
VSGPAGGRLPSLSRIFRENPFTMGDGSQARPPLRFHGVWRRYQELALDAFEADRVNGRLTTNIVAPPGSGKTLIGLEIARRIERPALALSPNAAVQAQWLASSSLFGAPSGWASVDIDAPLVCLTYQSLCQVSDPEAGLLQIAEQRWASDRARSTGAAVEDALSEGRSWTGAAAQRRHAELRRIVANLKAEIARSDDGARRLIELLGTNARERVERLRERRIGAIILDECHHLASLWGYIVRAALAGLDDVHVVGLTATPPGTLTREQTALYAGLIGPVDFTVPTPAVVRDGCLAPYQELA